MGQSLGGIEPLTRREKTGSLTVWAVSHSEHCIFLGYLYIKNATVIYLDNFKSDWLIGGGLRTFQKLSGHNFDEAYPSYSHRSCETVHGCTGYTA